MLKDTAFERQRAFLLGSQDTVFWLSTDVTVYKEDLHKAPEGPLCAEVYAWQYVSFLGTSGWEPSRIPRVPNPGSREKLL